VRADLAIGVLSTPTRLLGRVGRRQHRRLGRVAAGGSGRSVSYGYDLVDNYRRAAIHADRMRGTKPSELPVQLPVKVQLTIDLRTAKALGPNVPSSFLLSADEVIE